VLGALTALSAACSGASPSTLDPHGPGAARISVLWWVMFGLSVLVIGTVVGLLWFGLRRRKRPEGADDGPGLRLIVGGGVIVPAIVLTVLFVFMVRDLGTEARELSAARLTVDVIAHQWWWEVRYEGAEVVTANEIHIPVGSQVKMNLTTDDVIHSYWVPQLQAKVDMIPGRVNEIALQADDAGVYRGICGEFCGLQHAKMQFLVVAQESADFDAWLGEQRSTPAGNDAGRDAFLGSTCGGCHTVAGTEAVGTLGPDLSHFGGRRTIGAGALPNTPENLSDWILDAQQIKPGSKMPPQPVSPDELAAIVDYLEGLK
jgi:cytochrome c oxidase subunit 2